jgi:endogenous inhibitor of DNA gyrase (YacG/DUF329 family)
MSQPDETRKCAVCGKPQIEAFRPFCSKRCRQIDLGKWLGERYAIPAEEGPDGPSEEPDG